MNLSEKLKSLRKEKNVSQEKLANYLNVSFQAVSKWENANTYPDISLLPDIARVYGITVDELLQVEKLDEARLYDEYEEKAEAFYRNGDYEAVLKLFQEAYKKMPNNIEVKEKLMSTYYDIDKIKYQNEIIELGNEIYNTDNVNTYYKGQVCNELAILYNNLGNIELAEKWANKSYPLHQSRELIFTKIFDSEETIYHVSLCTYWMLHEMYWMVVQIVFDSETKKDNKYKQGLFEKVSKIYETVYENDDMSFETMKLLCKMHLYIAKFESLTTSLEDVIKYHLERSCELAKKSLNIIDHKLNFTMLDKWHIQSSPDNNEQVINMVKNFLTISEFAKFKDKEWFFRLCNSIN